MSPETALLSLFVYTFGTGVAQQSSARTAAMHACFIPRSQPDRITVNARCLDHTGGPSLDPFGTMKARMGAALLDEVPAESRHRDGTLRARLQLDAGDEHHRPQTAHRSDRGIAGCGASLTGRLHCPDSHSGSPRCQWRLFVSKIPNADDHNHLIPLGRVPFEAAC